jgi:two-component system OmpR family response regulator
MLEALTDKRYPARGGFRMTHNILLIDDDDKVSQMLTQYLTREGFKITTAFSGYEGEAAISSQDFDAVILDIMLPDINGLEVLRRIRSNSDVPVIMLTAKGDDIDRVIGLEMGADDYMAKPYFPRELLARLRARLRRDSRREQPNLTGLATGALELSFARREVSWHGKVIELTITEFNLLAALMKTESVVITKDDLSAAVLGRRREQYDRSIDVHAGHLRRKIATATGGKIEIETVRGIGYRLKHYS